MVIVVREKHRRHMNVPAPTVIRDFRDDLDQTLDEQSYLVSEMLGIA